MSDFIPFFINSNICTQSSDTYDFDTFMTAIAGNTGNSYITYSLLKELNFSLNKDYHIQNIYKYDFSQSEKDIDKINNECTHVFLILQDQIRIQESYGYKLPYKDIIQFINKLNKPVIIAGLGANSFDGYDADFHKKLSTDLVNFLKFLSAHCNSIGIRGNYTAEILHNLGIDNINVIGCPSFYETGDDRYIEKKEIKNIKDIILTSIFRNKELLFNYQICQDFCEENIIKAIAFNDYNYDFQDVEQKKLKDKKYRVYTDMEEWKNFIKNFKFAIGYRLHGSIVALNAGIPAMCCNGDSRAREMCEFLHIPYNPDIKSKDNILKVYEDIDISDVNNTYKKLYSNFAKFIKDNTSIDLYNTTVSKPVNQTEKISLNLYNSNKHSFIRINNLLNKIPIIKIFRK
ncbi:polysaccharide pyruvyl transferase family protein [bacterium]|nr:polysaccharide pyruvyl transferase family protein [bacterium]